MRTVHVDTVGLICFWNMLDIKSTTLQYFTTKLFMLQETLNSEYVRLLDPHSQPRKVVIYLFIYLFIHLFIYLFI